MNFQMSDRRDAKRPLATEDIAMLRAVLRDHCDIRHIDRTSKAGLARASELLRLFQAGVSDKECLRERLEAVFPGL